MDNLVIQTVWDYSIINTLEEVIENKLGEYLDKGWILNLSAIDILEFENKALVTFRLEKDWSI